MQPPDLGGNLEGRVLGRNGLRRGLRTQRVEALHRQHLLPKHMPELPCRLMRNLLKPRHVHARLELPAPGWSPACP